MRIITTESICGINLARFPEEDVKLLVRFVKDTYNQYAISNGTGEYSTSAFNPYRLTCEQFTDCRNLLDKLYANSTAGIYQNSHTKLVRDITELIKLIKIGYETDSV